MNEEIGSNHEQALADEQIDFNVPSDGLWETDGETYDGMPWSGYYTVCDENGKTVAKVYRRNHACLIADAPKTLRQRDDLLAVCRLLIEENKYAQFVSLRDNPPRGSIWGACRSSMAAARLKAEVVIKAIVSVQKAKVTL